MVAIPDELNPLNIFLQLLFLEAVQSGNDQILMIARPRVACVYFLSHGQVCHTVDLPYEQARGLFESVRGKTRMQIQGENMKFTVRCHVENEQQGECLSVLLQKSDEDFQHIP